MTDTDGHAEADVQLSAANAEMRRSGGSVTSRCENSFPLTSVDHPKSITYCSTNCGIYVYHIKQ